MIGYDEWHWLPTKEEVDEIATQVAQSLMGLNVRVECHIAGLLPPPPKENDAAKGGKD